MAYDERLAKRIRGYFKQRKGVEEKHMFGGLCFMLNGHMCCGVEKDRLMVCVTADRNQTTPKKRHAWEMVNKDGGTSLDLQAASRLLGCRA